MADVEVLGNKIKVAGLSELKRDEIIVLKKLLGRHVNKIETTYENLKEVKITHKLVHNSKHELHINATFSDGQTVNVESINNNLFIALNDVFNALESELRRVYKK